jgi:hypothetical protein
MKWQPSGKEETRLLMHSPSLQEQCSGFGSPEKVNN